MTYAGHYLLSVLKDTKGHLASTDLRLIRTTLVNISHAEDLH